MSNITVKRNIWPKCFEKSLGASILAVIAVLEETQPNVKTTERPLNSCSTGRTTRFLKDFLAVEHEHVSVSVSVYMSLCGCVSIFLLICVQVYLCDCIQSLFYYNCITTVSLHI